MQLSIDKKQPAAFHYNLAKKLAGLRDEGILVAASGNLVHNLQAYWWSRDMPDPYGWAVRFERIAKELMLAGDYEALINYETLVKGSCLKTTCLTNW